jgi:selenocysteine lyase/cysteine desulfurase
MQQYINFDNAASTPSLKPVLDTVNEFMEWYSSIHRGTGFKSQLASELYEEVRDIVAQHVNVDPETHSIIFLKNTTEAINKLAHRMSIAPDQVVLVSMMEHHSNDLPWRANGKVVHIRVHRDGRLDENDLVAKLKEYQGKVAIVSITGASNVTGWVNDVNRLAEICHAHGTRIMVDAAQLAPHRAIDMRPQDDPGHIDFLAFSAHKMYAPYGTGVLIGDKEFFEQGAPEYTGGGTIKIVSLDHLHWADPPEKDEAGTPNTVGVIALGKVLLTLNQIGMDRVAEHEKELTHYMLKRMAEIPRVEIYGSSDPEVVDNRLGVITFNLKEIPHALTAAILNYEGGIGVRNGCFCAHPYIKYLMGMDEQEALKIEQEILNNDRSRLPGAVRASFGMYNTTDEIDHFIDVLKTIASENFRGTYEIDRIRGEYHPENWEYRFEEYFRW